MEKRQRVLDAISHKETDCVPWHADFTHQQLEKMIQHTGDADFAAHVGNHITGVYYDGYLQEKADRPGYFQDDFGVLWNRNGADKDIGMIVGAVIPEPDISLIRMPAIQADRLHQELREMAQRDNGCFRLGSIGFSLFERAWTLRGMEDLLADMIQEPAFVDALLDAICEHNLKVMDIALEYPLDGFYFGDDWGQQKGLIMGPALWRRFIRPRLTRMYAHAKEKGLKVFQHSCGDIHDVFPDLIEIGLDVYQTFQPEIYDIRLVKKEFGRDLTFFGGISTQRLLPFGTPEEVRAKTREILSVMRPGGGYILSPTHAVPGDVPPENIMAMLDVFKHQDLP